MENKNSFDEMLRGKLDGAPSRLPQDMLDRILESKRNRKKAMFFWLNFSVGVYLIALIGLIASEQTPAREVTRAIGSATSTEQSSGQSAETKKEPGKVEEQNIPLAENSNPNPAPAPAVSNEVPEVSSSNSADNSIASEPVKSEVLVKPDLPVEPEKLVKEEDKKPVEPEKIVVTESIAANETMADTTRVNSAQNVLDKPDTIAKNDQDNDKTGKDKNWKFDWGKVGIDVNLSYGRMRETNNLKFGELDMNYTHRDYESFLKSAVKPFQGGQVSLGLRANYGEKFFAQSDFRYFSAQNQYHFEYYLHDVPVIDTNGQIKGYVDLPNQYKTTYTYEKTVRVVELAIPVQFGYIQKAGKHLEFQGMLGIMPQFHLSNSIALPEKVNLTSIKDVEMGKLFSMPATLGFGAFYNYKEFKIGANFRFTPWATSKMVQGIQISNRQQSLDLILSYRLFSKGEKLIQKRNAKI